MNSLDCPICIDTQVTKNVLSLNCCENRVHLECFYKWIQENACCPICRDEINISSNLNFLTVNIDTDEETSSLPLLNHNSTNLGYCKCLYVEIIFFTIACIFFGYRLILSLL
jgi:hypothetical protein